MQNEILDYKAECQIIAFPWAHPTTPEYLSYDEVAKANPIDVSPFLISSISFEKELSKPSGSFSFQLDNSRDWKRIIRPGTWCLIYMTQTGGLSLPAKISKEIIPTPNIELLPKQKKYLRGICYIERVAVKGGLDGNGTLDITYEVSGRDFGIVYEEDTIWQNFFLFESGIIDAATALVKSASVQTIDGLLKIIHQLFYSPTEFPSLANSDPKDKDQLTLSQVGFQWLMPKELFLAVDLKIKSGLKRTFFGHIDGLLNFKTTKATIPIWNPLSTLNGNAWEKLKSNSLEAFHELFPCLDDEGNPRLFFRPIPWKLDGSGYPHIAEFIQFYVDLAKTGVQLKTSEILEFDLGEDDHNRYTHFFTYIQGANYAPYDNISELQNTPSPKGNLFPFADLNAIARHGFRPMHVVVDSLIQLGLNLDAKANQGLLVEYNEVIKDYWQNSALFESGSAMILGRNDMQIGKALVFPDDAPYNAGKMFYIEGYVDEFTIEENGVGEWNQSLKLTRGAEIKTLKNAYDFTASLNQRVNEFKNAGEFTEK